MSAHNHPLPVVLSAAAQADFEDIRVYTLRTWDEAQWVRYRSALDRAFRTIGDNPEVGRSRDDLPRGYRAYPVEQHVILYRLAAGAIRVSRIIHRRMDMPRALQRRR